MKHERGPYPKGVAKREEILRVALEVVAEKGCRNTSIREISERVGLTQTGLMHYFDSREALYVDVLRTRDAYDVETYWNPQPNYGGFLNMVEHNTTVPGLIQLYVEYSAEASIGKHPAHDYFAERYAWVRNDLRGALLGSQRTGEVGPHVNVDEAVDLIIASSDGLQQQWLIDPSIDMKARLQQLWALIRASSWVAEP